LTTAAFLFALARMATVGLIALAGLGFGMAALGRFERIGPGERAVLATGLGLGMLGTGWLLAGVFGALTRITVLLTVAAGVCLSPLSLRRVERRDGWRLRAAAAAALALGLAALSLASFHALYPPTAFDATMYHLPMAKAYAASGRIAPLPDLRFPVFPALNEVLFSGAMLLCDDVSAQLVETLFFGRAAAGIVKWTTRAAGGSPGLWSLALWLSSPAVLSLASVAYVDMGLTTFAFFAIAACARWLETAEARWLRLAGAFAGFAAGTKYSGLFFAALVLATVLLSAARGTRVRAVRDVLLFAAASGGCWYASSFYWTGDPVWPFFGGVFGYRFWSRGDVGSLLWSLHSFGSGRSLGALLRLPFRLALGRSPSEPGMAAVALALLLLAIVVSIRRRLCRFPTAVAVAYVVFWFFTTQQPRFLLPVVPVLCVLGALVLAALTESARGDFRTFLRRLVSLGALVLAGRELLAEGRRLRLAPPLPVTPGARDAFLEQLPSYPVYRELNHRHHGAYAIYALHDESMKYYCEGRHLGDWFGPDRYADVPLGSGTELFAWLRKRGVSYLLVNESQPSQHLPDDDSFRDHFERVDERGPIVAYALKAP
jgi:hypothetical protein